MRAKRAKAYRKAMHFYQQTFGFHEPYQVLMSPDFVLAAVEKKVDIKQAVQDALQGQVKFYITYCGICDVRKEGEFMAQAIAVSKTFEKRRCMHKEPVSGTQCIDELMGGENKNNYCVAAQSDQLRAGLRAIAGVPVLHMQRNIVVLERMAQSAKDASAKQLKEKLGVSAAEKKLLREVKKKAIEEKLALRKVKSKKAKKPKGPNPLSVKKQSKKQQAKAPAPSASKAATLATSPSQATSLAGTKRSFSRSEEAPNKRHAPDAASEPANTDQAKHKRKRTRTRSRSKKSESATDAS
ncbi:hypothetical protein FB645_005538 [Coemansia sp. IMI 203386]|nr:hypothetical protein FB645_005538 [Coemansia sp. IMI 203386]